MPRLNPNLVVALAAGVVGAGTLLLVPSQISGETLAALGNMESPAFFPILAAWLIIVCSVGLGVRSLTRGGAGQQARVEFPRPWSVLSVIVIFVLFAAGTYYLGMVPAAVLMIMVMAYLLEYRNPKIVLPVAVAVPVGIYLLFEKLLLILLPSGVIFQE